LIGSGFNFKKIVIFPKWTNSVPLVLAAAAALAGAGVAAGVTIYFTPKYWTAGIATTAWKNRGLPTCPAPPPA
jgi:hypothetical protein